MREKQSLDWPDYTVGSAGNLFRYHRNHRINIYLGPVGFYWCIYALSEPQVNHFQMRNATGDYKEVWKSSKSHNSEAEIIAAIASNLDTVLDQLERDKSKP
jgi:hypothetical protein